MVIFINSIVVSLMVKIIVFIVIVMVNFNDIRSEVLFINVSFCKMFMIFFGMCFSLIILESVIVSVGESIVVSVKVGISGMFGII